ncbi:HlyD family secretion protein [Parahaliea mediterranea]|uniref:HlyD family secretion protein n=1 Tax=Parahaliea mediterranea TaxID=651086 RepID=UPI000E2E529D|nr:HlyD family efflux transporter periplasmic adaptor subunit [Parahaliea mediterranea]
MQLFRPEALQAQRKAKHGSALFAPHAAHTAIVSALLVWIVTAAVFLANTSYARKATVQGWLEPRQGSIRVYARGEGRIARVLVNEGEQVNRGQPLLVINGDTTLKNGEHLEELLLTEYRHQKSLLEKRSARQQVIALQRAEELKHRILATEQGLALLQEELSTLDQRQAQLSARISRHRSLVAAGHLAEVELESLLDQQLLYQAQAQSLTREREEHRARLASAKSQLELSWREHEESVDTLALSLSELSQKIAELRGHRAYVIKASADGRIANLQARPGHTARQNLPLMTIEPATSELEARLFVPVEASGFIRAGQTVNMRFDAFPYQKFGVYRGTVLSMSDAVLLPGEIMRPGTPVNGPGYSLIARLDTHSIQAYGKSIALRSGMTLAADITLEDRSVLEWLLEPILSLRGRL